MNATPDIASGPQKSSMINDLSVYVSSSFKAPSNKQYMKQFLNQSEFTVTFNSFIDDFVYFTF